jgi:Lrp/AsnC family transcriptional regulator of ectoine degradation
MGTRMKKTGLDAIDIRILSAVQTHGQLSKTRLAEIRLKAAGYIRAFRAEIALERVVDFTRVIVTVSLTHHRRADFDRFESHIAKVDEIADCVATGGGMDYIMTVYVRNVAAFETLMAGLLDSDLGIDRYMTYFTTRTVKATPPNLPKLCVVPSSSTFSSTDKA